MSVSVEIRQAKAMEDMAKNVAEMTKAVKRLSETLVDIGKMFKGALEDSEDLPLETEELPLRWGHETVGTAKVQRDDSGNLMVTGIVTDERLHEVLQDNVKYFSQRDGD